MEASIGNQSFWVEESRIAREIGPNKNLNKTENPDNKENHEKTQKKE